MYDLKHLFSAERFWLVRIAIVLLTFLRDFLPSGKESASADAGEVASRRGCLHNGTQTFACVSNMHAKCLAARVLAVYKNPDCLLW